MKIRKLLRVLHRDLGYFIVAMTIVYAVSGIYLNHRHDFNPDYQIEVTDFTHNLEPQQSYAAKDIRDIVESVDDDVVYKKHYVDQDGDIRVFIANGEVLIDPNSGEGRMRYLQRRPLVFGMNKLHRATLGTAWKWVSDAMAVILLFVAVSGLFLLKGKRGLMRWGWWLTIAGFVVPLLFIIFYI
ncbi:PepSY-associated TM helix domain-containing protein [Draconibacterium sp. IB214405]|uniref:PepSY-associated TM helix domain-containing protein n=1 Tax=Draconibacterium sp. IB214405 TaxID=3097352 RepID=UPI002A0FAD28|nr:PepSY-associated TM helix domain-containing protein [Draconibacterium sp. IB214405]MDX8339528.1 PepSY-associated TM helix domain-containing protein [Draconibacterium sp. IB214405]